MTWREAENLAAEYLLSKGFVILQRNFRIGYLEIDIVAQKREMIYAIEVRYRQRAEGAQHNYVSQIKLYRMYRAAEQLSVQLKRDVSLRLIKVYWSAKKSQYICKLLNLQDLYGFE